VSSSLWWFLVGVALALELVSATFVLLFFALGFAAAALMSWLDSSLTAQLLAASVGMLAGMAWWAWRRDGRWGVAAQDLDVGRLLAIPEWDARGEAEVFYRGTVWRARWVGDGLPQTGLCRIAGFQGNVLLMQARDPSPR
jgi:membrane protein implicated in regulation of membrane protease activity